MPKLPRDPIAEARQNWISNGWAPAADGMAALTSIMRAHQILLARVDQVLRNTGLTFARFEMLRLLGFTRDGTMSLARARDLLQIHPASVTNIVDRLEADDLLQRAAHPGDGRALIVKLLPAGRELVEKATRDLNEGVFEVLEFGPSELLSLTDLLTDFRQRVGDFEEPSRPPGQM